MTRLALLSNLTALCLKDTGLRYDIERNLAPLSCLHRLQALDLSHNCLHDSYAAVSCAISHLQHLRSLNLAQTASPISDLHPLAISLRQLPALETFAVGAIATFRSHKLSRSLDSRLAESLLALVEALPAVRTLQDTEAVFGGLRLSRRQLARLTSGLGALTTLRRLRVSTAVVTRHVRQPAQAVDGVHEAITHALPQLSALRILDLGFDAERYGGVGVLARALRALTGLHELRLRGYVVGDGADVDSFAAACATLRMLQCLEVRGGHPSAAFSLRFIARLAQLPQLRRLRATLVIDSRPVCKEDVCAIAAAMPRCAVQLDATVVVFCDEPSEQLQLDRLAPLLPAVVSFAVGSVTGDPGSTRMAAVTASLPQSPAITSLSLQSSTASVVQLLQGCGGLRCLQNLMLFMYHNIAGEEGPADVADRLFRCVLPGLPGLTCLSLSGDDGMVGDAIVACCGALRQLRELSLRWTRRPQGVLHVGRLQSLRTLQLYNAPLPGTRVFCDEVARLTCLRDLHLMLCSPEWPGVEVKERLAARMPHLNVLGTDF